METAAVLPVASSGAGRAGTEALGTLNGDDFLKLLIAQLSNQDPLEPTSNQDLMQQISAIRDIELSTTLVESLQALTSQQRFAAAPALIGKFVTAAADPTNPGLPPVGGIVTGVRYQPDGQIVLLLDSGAELALDHVEAVSDAAHMADSLLGMKVTGIDSADPNGLAVISGVVTGIRADASGRVTLELDTGESFALTDLISTESLEGGTL